MVRDVNLEGVSNLLFSNLWYNDYELSEQRCFMKKLLRYCCISAIALVLSDVNAEELEIASLIRTKCVDETNPNLKGKKNGILYISDRFEKHLNKLKNEVVKDEKRRKKKWLQFKFADQHIKSVKNVITSELCRIYCDINPYASGGYTNNVKDVILLDSDKDKVFKDIASYTRGNWNYLFLINYMNLLKNGITSSTRTTPEILNTKLEAIKNALKERKIDVTEKMAKDMQKSVRDIAYYVDNLRLKEFWTENLQKAKDRCGNKIDKNKLFAEKDIYNLYGDYLIQPKLSSPHGIANMGNNCYITAAIEMLYSNNKIRAAIREMANKISKDKLLDDCIELAYNTQDEDNKLKQKVIDRGRDYERMESTHIALCLSRIFDGMERGIVSSAAILELVNRINKFNIVLKLREQNDNQRRPKIKLYPYDTEDASVALDGLISALAGIGMEFDDKTQEQIIEELGKVKDEGPSVIYDTNIPKNIKPILETLTEKQENIAKILEKRTLSDYIIYKSKIGQLLCLSCQQTSIMGDNGTPNKNHTRNVTDLYCTTLPVTRIDDDLQKCFDSALNVNEYDTIECGGCSKIRKEQVEHQMHVQRRYQIQPKVLILNVAKDHANPDKFAKLNVPDYLKFGSKQYVLRSAIIHTPHSHYIMKGIAQNGDIYCINDDASAIMQPNPEKTGQAQYIIPNGRQLSERSHELSEAIKGDKTLNHLDVEDGTLFMYERVDW